MCAWVLGFPMSDGLRGHFGRGDLHFITFSCYRRLPLAKTICARDIFVQELSRVRTETGFHLLGYVLMPEYVHSLMSEPKVGTPSAAIKKLKQCMSRRMRGGVAREQFQSKPAHSGESLRSFWQAQFYDFSVYSEGKKTEKLNNMHANPVIRGLVKHPKDWPWSGWSFYVGVERTLVQMDVEE
jgi:putative transposase